MDKEMQNLLDDSNDQFRSQEILSEVCNQNTQPFVDGDDVVHDQLRSQDKESEVCNQPFRNGDDDRFRTPTKGKGMIRTTNAHNLTPGEKLMVNGDETRVPYEGMEYKSIEEAEVQYNNYALYLGFGIRRKNVRKSRKTGKIIQRIFCCSKQGWKDEKENVQKQRASTRDGCMAMMQVTKEGMCMWKVSKFIHGHSHELLSPRKTIRLRSHRRISKENEELIRSFTRSNFKATQIVKFIRGENNAPLSKKDCRNVISKEQKRSISGGDATASLKLLSDMQRKSPMFYFNADLEEDGMLRSLFWVHAKSRMDYKAFNDVITFDSTYKTNIYGMPFAPFIGVNNHYQSILLGVALLSDETIESYVWVLKEWLKAMGDKEPNAIITDQDLSLKAAIGKVLPNLRHRFCIWHIKRNFFEKLGPKCACEPRFLDCINKSRSPEEFDTSWRLIIEEECLEDNMWLKAIYKDRDQWVHAYLRGSFFAGMSSTQRSESMNSFFDAYVNHNISLLEFIKRYDEAFHSRLSDEIDEETRNINSRFPLQSKWPLAISASNIYTLAIFNKFHNELVERSSFYLNMVEDGSNYKIFEVANYINEDEKEVVQTWQALNKFECTCNKFKFKGWACRHMLRVMEDQRVRELPSDYILKRWTKKAKEIRGDGEYIIDISELQGESLVLRNVKLRRIMERYIDVACRHETSFKRAMELITHQINEMVGEDNAISALRNVEFQTNEGENEHISQTIVCSNNDMIGRMTINDPRLHRSKGRPSQRRLITPIEKTKKQKRRCSECNELGHYNRTCMKRKKQLEKEVSDGENENSV